MSARCGILGLGAFVPAQVRTNDFWQGKLKPQAIDENRAVIQNSVRDPQGLDFGPFEGIEERRVAPDSMHPSDLELRAARRALDDAGIDASQIDLIIINSCPSDDYLPNNATKLQTALGLDHCSVLGVDTACTSFLSGLRVADAMVRAGEARTVLVVVSALLTRLVSYDSAFSASMGDGAGAAVVGLATRPKRGMLLAHAQSGQRGTHDAAVCAPMVGRWYEKSEALVGHFRDQQLAKKGMRNNEVVARDGIAAALDRASVDAKAVRYFFSHQPTIWFNGLIRKAAGIEHASTVNTFSRYGSMGAANIPVNLWHWQQQAHEPGVAVLFGAGMGLNWAVSVIDHRG